MRSLLPIFIIFVSSCGGGNSTDSIASLTASNLRYGQLTTLKLSGKDLDHDIQLIPDPKKCTGLTLATATSGQTRTATCLVTGTGAVFFTVRSSAGYVLYTTSLHIPEPVSDIQSSNVGFGQINLTLAGNPQNPAIQLRSDKCSNISLSPVSESATRTATCTLLTTGPVRFDVTNLAGTSTLYSTTLMAPAPAGLASWNNKYKQKAYFAYPSNGISNLQFRSPACTDLIMDESASTADTRIASCTLGQIGNAPFEVVNPSTNTTIQSTTISVPQPQVTLTTSLGKVVMELNQPAAPFTVDNFLAYVNQSPSFYAGTIFHRVISGFVAQGGGFTSGITMAQKTVLRSPIPLESNNGLLNDRATVAMARTDVPNSATSQFYVNLTNNTSLNFVSEQSPGYTVFGRVVTGMEVIDQMATKPVKSVGSYSNVPVTDITILSAAQTQ